MANAKYEHILDLEFNVKSAQASVMFQTTGVPLYRKEQQHQALKRARDELYTALEALSPEEVTEYGPYRAQVMAEIRNRKVTG